MPEFVVDYENKVVEFCGERWDRFFYIINAKHACNLLGIYSNYTINKSIKVWAGQQFTTTYGITPTNFKRKFNAIMQELWIKPVEKHLKTYAFSYAGKIAPNKVIRLHENKRLIEQAEKDKLDNIIPFIYVSGKSPKELKEVFGKCLWKRLCKNSKTRNVLIGKIWMNNEEYINQTQTKEIISTLNQFPSKYLKRGFRSPYNFDDGGLYCIRNKMPSNFQYFYNDTKRMANQLGETFNSKWSPRKIKEKHEEFTSKINEKKYSKDTYPAVKDIAKRFTNKEFTAELLQSAYDIYTEGVSMRHCVGSYAGDVANGDYLVYSIRDKDNNRYSTLGIRKDRDNKWVFDQHYKYKNKQVNNDDVKELPKIIIEQLNKENK